MKQVLFKDHSLQKLGRVKIPNAIIDSLKLGEGDSLDIILDTESEHIIIKKSSKRK